MSAHYPRLKYAKTRKLQTVCHYFFLQQYVNKKKNTVLYSYIQTSILVFSLSADGTEMDLSASR